jgi:tRNA-specific 2-thiouridylase
MKALDAKKVVLGMSGGIDSSVSLVLLKKAGYDVIGVSLRYDVYKCSKRKENVCCSAQSFRKAKKICEVFGAKHVILDVATEFNDEVIDYFRSELKKMNTPSPCVFCNRKVKFKSLIDYADKVGAGYVATGHYAKIEKIVVQNKAQFVLETGLDKIKDQTYSLSFLKKEYLPRIIFPLADLTKSQVYAIAAEQKALSFYKKIKQSQDFCFIDSAEIEDFISKEVQPTPGDIIDEKGSILGKHKGLSYFTIGQRKKIELSGGPYYVIDKQNPSTLVVSKDVSKSYSATATLKPINLLAESKPGKHEVLVKARSAEELKSVTLEIVKDSALLTFEHPVSQLVPGQIAVFYLENKNLSNRLICLGGGVINS